MIPQCRLFVLHPCDKPGNFRLHVRTGRPVRLPGRQMANGHVGSDYFEDATGSPGSETAPLVWNPSSGAWSTTISRFEKRIAATTNATLSANATASPAGMPSNLIRIGAASNETRLMTLIIGLSAGPAVSLSGSPTV